MRQRIRSNPIRVTSGGPPPPAADCAPTARALDSFSVDESNLRVTMGGRSDGGLRDSLAIADAYQRLTTVMPETLDIADAFPFASITTRANDSVALDEARLALNWIVAETLGVEEAKLLIKLGDPNEANSGFRDTLNIADHFAAPTITGRFADSVGVRESKLRFDITMVASQDTWVDRPPGCVGAGGNNNGTNLQIDPLVAGPRHTFIGWDMSVLPANILLDFAATSTITVYQTATPATAAVCTFSQHATAWNETTLVCGNVGATVNAPVGAGFNTNLTGDRVVTLDNSGQNHLQSAILNQVLFDVRVFPDTAQVGAAVFQSKDSGGSPGNTSGPRLRFTIELDSVT